MRRAILISSLFFASLPMRAQSIDFGETVEVRVANIDVAVTRRDGTRVTGLQAGDFELIVDGKPTPISNFYEARAAATPSATSAGTAPATTASVAAPPPEEISRRRVMAFVIDLYSLDLRRRTEAVASLRRFVDANVRPGDLAMLATWNRRMIIPLTLTGDRRALDAELTKLEKLPVGGLSRDRQLIEMRVRSAMQEAEVGSGAVNPAVAANQAYGAAITAVNHYAEEQAKFAENFSLALEELFRGLSGVEGKKVVVLVGENFPQYPGLGTYQFANEVFARYAGMVNFVVPQMVATQRSLSSLPMKLTRAANSSEITLHTIYTGEFEAESNVEQEESNGDKMMSRQLDFTNTGSTLAVMSRDTGGVALLGSRNFEGAVAQIVADLDSYYSIGYRLQGKTESRRVEVRTKDPSLVVRARRTIVERSLDDELASRVTSRLFQKESADSGELVVRVGAVKKERRDRIRVPVTVSFPTSLLTLLPRDADVVGGFQAIVAASDAENRLSEESRTSQDVLWKANAVPPRIEFTVDVIVRNMPGEISVGIIDRLSKTPFFKRVQVAKQ